MAEREVDTAIAAVEEQFAVLFSGVKTRMRGRAARVHPDLQPAAYMVLNALVRLGRLHAGALAETLGMDKSVVSRQARSLEDLGLLERQSDQEDGRATYFAATPVAVEKVTKVHLADQAMLHERLHDWPVSELVVLSRLLGQLTSAISD